MRDAAPTQARLNRPAGRVPRVAAGLELYGAAGCRPRLTATRGVASIAMRAPFVPVFIAVRGPFPAGSGVVVRAGGVGFPASTVVPA